MYAIIKACGRQYKVSEGQTVFVEKLDIEEGKDVTFNEVLLVADEKGVKIGTPTVSGASVTAKVVKHGRDKKIVIFKYKAKKNYKRKQGHRQPYTKIEIEKINV